MIRDREQPLNPPGIDAPDRKIVRQYIPMREYQLEANERDFNCTAEVEACGNRGQDMRVSLLPVCLFCIDDDAYPIPSFFRDSYISPTGPTWRELIEREICRQAALLPCTAWEVEYEGDE
jgi:hypothetical protein